MRVNISNNVTKQAIKDACTAYKNFFRGLQKKEIPGVQVKKDTLPVIQYVKFEGFPAGKQIKMNWVRLLQNTDLVLTNAKIYEPENILTD